MRKGRGEAAARALACSSLRDVTISVVPKRLSPSLESSLTPEELWEEVH